MTLELTTGDQAPSLTGTVNASLVGAQSVIVHIRRPDATTIVRPATVLDAAAGTWRLDWQSGDLIVTGPHLVEVQVTYASGKPQTFARDAANKIAAFNVRTQYA